MTPEDRQSAPSAEPESSAHRSQLSNLQGLVALSMVMTDSADAEHIVQLASSAVPSLAPARCDGAVVEERGWLGAAGPCARRSVRVAVEKQLRRLSALGGALEIEREPWAWGFPMGSLERAFGFFVIAAEAPPPDGEQFLLRLLAQYVGIAIANAELHARERGTAEALQTLNERLERSIAIHSRLTDAAVQGRGLAGIAEAIHDVTGYPVAIEDSHGNLVAWAGPDRAALQLPGRDCRAEIAEVARNNGAPVRVGDRLAVPCGWSGETVAVLALVDGAGTAGDEERMALEHGATVLALELSRVQSVLEAESRMGRDLLEDLLAGSDEEDARIRAQLLGYDLGQQQRVAVVECADSVRHEDLFHAVRRASHDVGIRSLLASRRGTVVVLTTASQPWGDLQAAIAAEFGEASCRVGVGGACDHVGDVPRSYREAQLALRLPSTGGKAQALVTSFDELGVFRILAEAEDPATVERFVRRWLGGLLDYDARRGAELVLTLSAYLESGGSHALSARALNVHRNTLRYRLTRIREISGHDLGEPDVQFNLQLATRAWRTLAAMPR